MKRSDLSRECKDLTLIIDNLMHGKEKFEIADDRYSIDDAIDYLRGFLQELNELNAQIVERGNTSELLAEVYEKYSELWLFQLSFSVSGLTRVIRGLWRYPDGSDE